MTEVALIDATPHAPSVIRLLLDKLNISFRKSSTPPACRLHARSRRCLLDDEIGALMVLFPQSHLLDSIGWQS